VFLLDSCLGALGVFYSVHRIVFFVLWIITVFGCRPRPGQFHCLSDWVTKDLDASRFIIDSADLTIKLEILEDGTSKL